MKKSLLFLVALCFPLVVQSAPEPQTLWRTTLPPNAIAYLRLPYPWGLFAMPKDNGLKEALSHQQHLTQIKTLEASMYQNVLKQVEALTHPALTFFFHHLRSPIEAVVLLPDNTFPPNVLLSAQLNLTSIAELNQFLTKFVAKTPVLQMPSPVASNGYGILQAGFIPVFLHYEVRTQTLNMMGGLMSNQTQFEQILAQRTLVEQHPMYALENRLDTSHQGLFSWVNLQKLLSSFDQMIPPPVVEQFQNWGLAQMNGIALGWGVSNGKSRLSFMLDAPRAGYLQFLPAISNNFTLTASGKPGTVISLSLPSLEWLTGIEQFLQKEMPTEEFQAYLTAKQELATQLGVTLETILQAIGPEIVFFTDAVGEFLAIKIQNHSKMQEIVTLLTQKSGATYRTREIKGHTYHHLIMPSSLMTELSAEAEDENPTPTEGSEGLLRFLLELAANIGSHSYWSEDEGYLILAHVPQLLFDRHQHLERISIQAWLKQQQRQDVQASMFVASTTLTETPRHLYYGYLQALTLLAEIAKTEIDLFALPSATELKLPHQGTYGMQIDRSDSLLALEFTFENNPLEFLLDIKMGMMAGILGALTIPAILAFEEEPEFLEPDYDDETDSLLKQEHPERFFAEDQEEAVEVEKEDEKVTISKPTKHKQPVISPKNETEVSLTVKIVEGFGLLSDLKTPAEIFFSERGYLPEVDEIEDYAEITLKGQYTQNLSLLETKNGYKVEFQDVNLEGQLTLLYDPQLRIWSCKAENLPIQHLPNACQ